MTDAKRSIAVGRTGADGEGDVAARDSLGKRRRRLSRIGVPLASAAALLVVAPAPPASAEVARGIYSSLTACRVAGFAWVALPYFETFECRGFYSAGRGGWRLYIE